MTEVGRAIKARTPYLAGHQQPPSLGEREKEGCSIESKDLWGKKRLVSSLSKLTFLKIDANFFHFYFIVSSFTKSLAPKDFRSLMKGH